MLLPNLITLLALCAGLTAIRLAVENKLELHLQLPKWRALQITLLGQTRD